MQVVCRCVFALLVFCLSITGAIVCPAVAAPPPEADAAFVEFRRMAVMPFFVGTRQPSFDEAADKTLNCPIGELCAGVTEIDPGAGRVLTRMVYDALRFEFGDQVVSLESSRDAYAEAVVDENAETPRLLARKLGKGLEADFVVVGTLWRYRDRGQVPGVPDSPASVAFALYLVDTETGRRVWRGIFDESQRPLTENLFKARQSLKMGVKWLSAQELARFGVEQVMKTFPTEEDLRKPMPAR